MCPQLAAAFPPLHYLGATVRDLTGSGANCASLCLSLGQQLVVMEGQASTLKLLWWHKKAEPPMSV